MYEVKKEQQAGGWTALDFPGAEIKVLYTDPSTGGMSVLTRLQAGATIPRHHHTKADEAVYVLEGDFVEDGQAFGPGAFFAGKAGNIHGPHSSNEGCIVLIHFSAALDFVVEN